MAARIHVFRISAFEESTDSREKEASQNWRNLPEQLASVAATRRAVEEEGAEALRASPASEKLQSLKTFEDLEARECPPACEASVESRYPMG